MRRALLLALAALSGCEAAFEVALPLPDVADPRPPAAPPVQWIRTFGSVEPDIANSVVLLRDGSPFIGGGLGGSPVWLEGEEIATGGAGLDGYVAGFTPHYGLLSRTHFLATAELEQTQSLSRHPEGGFVATGLFGGPVIDLGCESPLGSPGTGVSGFLAWYDPILGCLEQTAVLATGASEVALLYSAVDETGLVHATGRRKLGADEDLLFLRYDFATKNLFEKTFSGFAGVQRGTTIATRGGDTWVAGIFAQTLVLGTSTLVSRGGNDAFIARLDAAGDPVAALQLGGPSNEQPFGLELSPDGASLFVAGRIAGVSTFGGIVLTPVGTLDGFVARVPIDLSGVDWAVRISGPGADEVLGLTVGSGGDLFITGGITGVDSLGLDTTIDGFVARLRPDDGDVVWAYTFGGPGKDQPESIAVTEDAVFVVGQIGSDAELTFAPSPVVRGREDAFLMRLPVDGPP